MNDVARLTKTHKVMELVYVESDVVLFEQEETGVQIYMAQQDFEEFGSPDKITVTVEPGDRLNLSQPGSGTAGLLRDVLNAEDER